MNSRQKGVKGEKNCKTKLKIMKALESKPKVHATHKIFTKKPKATAKIIVNEN